ncbi:MAG: type II toxin-antitoxin system VapC family toxin [Caulobacteraceae bacterium]
MKACLLDTNALLCIGLDRSTLKPSVRRRLVDAMLYASVASAAEIAIKAALGKFVPPPPFETDFDAALRTLLTRAAVDPLPLGLPVVARLRHPPLHHRDPFDRMIIAQALETGLTIATRDGVFSAYPGLDILEI